MVEKTIFRKMICKIILRTLITLIIINIIGIIYNLYFHIKEEIAIDRFIKQYKLEWIANKKSKASAFVVSDLLRGYLNVNQSTWQNLDLEHQPFFRNSALNILRFKEGACGEGTRVLARILMKLGFNATRISLFISFDIANGHTLVSILIDGKEYFIDSVNSSEKVNRTLRNYDINSRCLQFKYYKDRVYLSNIDTSGINEGYGFIRKKFQCYSYDAVPLRKAINILFKNVVVTVYDRPGPIISYIAESYYLINVILFSMLALLFGLLIWIYKHVSLMGIFLKQ